jgi:exosortase B
MNVNVSHPQPPQFAPSVALPWPELVLLAIGLLFMYGPTYVVLDQQVWSFVGQGHGPVMFALALWLAWERKELLQASDGQPHRGLATGLLALGLVMYVIGRSQDILLLDTASQIPILGGVLAAYRGTRGLKIMWLPLFFFIFLIPMPSPVVDALTGPLKAGVSHVSEQVLYMAGYPVGRAGVTLTIGPYKLLVADACAGLNSIFALEAVGVFYMSIAKYTEPRRNVFLALLILPISFVSNVFRVVTLVLVTYYFGDEAGQGFVHGFAGILLFLVATLLMIAVDYLYGALFSKARPAAPRAPAA